MLVHLPMSTGGVSRAGLGPGPGLVRGHAEAWRGARWQSPAPSCPGHPRSDAWGQFVHSKPRPGSAPACLRLRSQAENGAANSAPPSPRPSQPRSSPRPGRWGVTATGAQDRSSPAPSGGPQAAEVQEAQASRPSAAPAAPQSRGVSPSSPGMGGGDLAALPPNSTQSSVPSPRPTFDDIMAFDGVPEIINGRLAMLGFVAGAFVELRDKVSFLDQVFDPSQHGLFFGGLAMLLITAASIVPLLRGSPSSTPGFLFFTEEAEKANGRVAMLGLVGVFFLEYLASWLLKI